MIIGIDGNEANVKNRVGSGTYAFELIKQFHSLKDNHHFVILLKNPPLPDLPKETENFNYKVFGPKRLWTQFALPLKLTFGVKPDVFFSTAHYLPRFLPLSCPLVVTIHDLSFLHFPEMFKKSDLYQLTFGTKASIQKAAHIIAVSQTTKDDIVKSYKIDPSKIAVTYEGYNKERFKPQITTRSDLVNKKYGIKGEYIIFVGTLQPRKNLEKLLEAFKVLVDSSQFTVHSKNTSTSQKYGTGGGQE